MKLATYINQDQQECLGLCVDTQYYALKHLEKYVDITMPKNMSELLNNCAHYLPYIKMINEKLCNNPQIIQHDSVQHILSPVPRPTSCRDAYAFRQHVETMRKNRGAEMIPEFDQFPVFYFTNHQAVFGEGKVIVHDDHLDQLDFELEIAAVIGKQGKNIQAQNADDYIVGFMIMNDFSARTLQMNELKLNLGPAKGKDFANCFGPWLVTTDELEVYQQKTAQGLTYDLAMAAYLNGKKISSGNMSSMNWTFAQIIERISYGVTVYPGDVIGSGTVGTGCLGEINGTARFQAKANQQDYQDIWLKDQDHIELEVTGLGKLSNRIVREPAPYSILNK